jgi:predicted dehydrogenase
MSESTMPAPQPLRIAMLGTGWTAGMHAARATAIPGVSVVAACGRTRSAAEAFCAPYKATAYDDCTRMLEQERLDALYICLPPFAHHGQVEAAAKRGVHLFLEKPIAGDVARGRSQRDACLAAGIITQVGYHLRHGTATRALKQAQLDGRAGRPTLFQASWRCNNIHSAWWRDLSKSGGQLVEQAIHLYDLACWYLGTPVEVSAQAQNLCHGAISDYTVEDTSAAVVRFASGAMAAITASNCAIPGEWTPSWNIVCERMTVDFTSCNQARFVATAPQVVRWQESREVDPYQVETEEFIHAIRGGPATSAPIGHGFESLRLVHAAWQSALADGRPVRLP